MALLPAPHIIHLPPLTPRPATAQYTLGSSTTTYTPGASSPTPQYATTPQYTTLGIHDAGRDAAHAPGQAGAGQQDLYFYTLVPSPVSSASTSSGSATSELCSASEESTSESDSEGEEGYDAQAYTERTTDFAMRHTPAAADFAQPRAHRPMVYLSSPASAASDNGRESDERDAEPTYVPVSSKARDHPAAPQRADHHA
ncbi:hypothetical protein C8J57DRAFT_1736313 [Mycena rebaudengoi]|nr:hypothetical protein C8J57DRAFT_1736313 [Mycena rebaudengoi]